LYGVLKQIRKKKKKKIKNDFNVDVSSGGAWDAFSVSGFCVGGDGTFVEGGEAFMLFGGGSRAV